jgi:hypothetical protein
VEVPPLHLGQPAVVVLAVLGQQVVQVALAALVWPQAFLGSQWSMPLVAQVEAALPLPWV